MHARSISRRRASREGGPGGVAADRPVLSAGTPVERGQGTPVERARLRQAHFARPLKWLHRLAQTQRERALPESQLGKACVYLLTHWKPLTAHLQHEETRLNNDLIENAIRPSAIGARNFLFIGHPDAGQRSATIYSIVVSCRRHGKDPLAYLRDGLTRLPAMTRQYALEALTPANWKPA